MKKNKRFIYIGLSALALLCLLAIQVSWLVNTAQVKEDLFAEKANMVLSKTAQEICADQATCKRIGDCCSDMAEGHCELKLGKAEKQTIDSLLQHFMKVYQFQIPYTFTLQQNDLVQTTTKNKSSVFKHRIEELAHVNGLELHLEFPSREKFILQEMGLLFGSSVVLIFIVFGLFIYTIRALIKEQKVAEQTIAFINNMTHEFKTPLTNIALANKMMGKLVQPENETKWKKYSSMIVQENEKLQKQVEQVLRLVAFEQGEWKLQMQEINMHEIIGRVAESMQVQIEDREGVIRTDFRAKSCIVLGDSEHVFTVICNLLDNAIKYSKGAPVIEILSFSESGKFALSIKDNGFGISAENQAQIFDKYYRVPTGNVHDIKGFGLGLAYVKNMVEAMGGSVVLSSELGKGSCFTLYFPLKNGN
ncbi:MAG: ATP-binding protein [Bacteroidia bacterium]|nr:ATP-binding protein [Bacteroidia bacterium]